MNGRRDYAAVTAAYWTFTLSDGALRMLVLLHFHTLGFTPFQLAFLFLLYESCGVVTNLLGGWIGARTGVKATLCAGIALQILALLALSGLDERWASWLSIAYVVAAQGLSGIAKDLTKMSAKSAVKLVAPEGAHGALFKWVALLTGSKNALKGAGFFLGGLLLGTLGFVAALWTLAAGLALALAFAAAMLPGTLGRAREKEKFSRIFSRTPEINLLSTARFFLFGARDVWFVVGVPIFLYETLGWTFAQVGTFLAVWVVGYGAVQAAAPGFVRRSADGRSAEIRAARLWAFALALVPVAIALVLSLEGRVGAAWPTPGWTIVVGLGIFGFVFAVNSSVHSYLILAYAESDKVALDVGFYYMANAGGRLVGTLLSGLTYQFWGLTGCLSTASAMVALSWSIALALPAAAGDANSAAPMR